MIFLRARITVRVYAQLRMRENQHAVTISAYYCRDEARPLYYGLYRAML